MNQATPAEKSTYHHGDLKQSLLRAAHAMLKQTGIDGVTLRKLAERVGVSRAAPYHHFANKNELLCAIAEQGFTDWQQRAEVIRQDPSLQPRQRFRRFFFDYVIYATENPELYELMFGRIIWKTDSSTDSLKQVAYPSFQYQLELVREWQAQGVLPDTQDPLRLSQVTWSTMHGLARLIIDGIYPDTSHVAEMVDCAVDLFISDPVAEQR